MEDDIYDMLYDSCENFRQFVKENEKLTTEEIALKYGIDLEQICPEFVLATNGSL